LIQIVDLVEPSLSGFILILRQRPGWAGIAITKTGRLVVEAQVPPFGRQHFTSAVGRCNSTIWLGALNGRARALQGWPRVDGKALGGGCDNQQRQGRSDKAQGRVDPSQEII